MNEHSHLVLVNIDTVQHLLNQVMWAARLLRMHEHSDLAEKMEAAADLVRVEIETNRRQKQMERFAKLFAGVGIVVLGLLLAAPAMAQDVAGGVAQAAEAAPYGLEWKDIIILALIALVVAQSLATRRMLPPELVLSFLGTMKDSAARTPSQQDDRLVGVVESVVQRMLGEREAAVQPVPDFGTRRDFGIPPGISTPSGGPGGA